MEDNKKKLIITTYGEDNDILERFRKMCIYLGKDIDSTIIEIICEFNYLTYSRKSMNVILVTENELLNQIRNEDLKTNKALLVKYRKDGTLVQNDMFWSDNKRHVVYDLDKTIKVLKSRTRNRKIKKENVKVS